MYNKRLLITIFGKVQGVGFRPFAYRLAKIHDIAGSICNTGENVILDVEGKCSDIELFQQQLRHDPPKHAKIDSFSIVELPLRNVSQFTIELSAETKTTALGLLADTAICAECLDELFDTKSRRYRYPFLHCICCGPRFSILSEMPFDRHRTAMNDFKMCSMCEEEYHNTNDRRFYSQTNCCSACGPEISLYDHNKSFIANQDDAMAKAIHYLQDGKILALKNTGGFQLLVDATNTQAVKRLRDLKKRIAKPFALLVTLAMAKGLSDLSNSEQEILSSHENPIVLLRKNFQQKTVSEEVAPQSPFYGLLLAHSPLQYLLLNDFNKPLVATSGNLSGKALCIDNQEAFNELSDVADFFLIHDRKIINPVDDSIVQVIDDDPMMLRRSRGYIPYMLSTTQSNTILGAGGHLKNTFSIANHHTLYLSQHIGNLDNVAICDRYQEMINSWQKLLKIKPKMGVGDQHPRYFTTQYLEQNYEEVDFIQHHHAHVFSGMLDNQLTEPFMAVAWDGSGHGIDGTIWGGEFFVVQNNQIERVASLLPFSLPGGEKAIQEPRRVAFSLLQALPLFCKSNWENTLFSQDEIDIFKKIINGKINSPLCSSIGRLFDGVSAFVTGCMRNTFEGQAALALEAVATSCIATANPYSISWQKNNEIWLLDWRSMLENILTDIDNEISLASISNNFHQALSNSIIDIANIMGYKKILLTGGVMQNRLLLELTIKKLRDAGFQPYWHRHIPPNDGGLSVGQLVGKEYLCV